MTVDSVQKYSIRYPRIHSFDLAMIQFTLSQPQIRLSTLQPLTVLQKLPLVL